MLAIRDNAGPREGAEPSQWDLQFALNLRARDLLGLSSQEGFYLPSGKRPARRERAKPVRATVTFYEGNANERTSRTFAKVADALAFAMALKDDPSRGRYPSIAGDGWTALACRIDPWGKARTEWAMSMPGRDGFKTPAIYRAEAAGIHYASHRKGYRASQTAFRRFVADWDRRAA